MGHISVIDLFQHQRVVAGGSQHTHFEQQFRKYFNLLVIQKNIFNSFLVPIPNYNNYKFIDSGLKNINKQPYCPTRILEFNMLHMQDLVQQNQEEREAIQSLLELESSAEHPGDWKQIQQSQRKSKRSKLAFNFIQVNRKPNPEVKDSQVFMYNQKLSNLNRFRKVRSLFDPMKIFKVGSHQLMYQEPLTPQPMISSFRNRIIHKHPQSIRNLNFKSGHPSKTNVFSKKEEVCLQELKNKSIQFLNGQSVMIQVQSYEQTFNRKEVQYLMSKTLGSRDFKSQMGFHKKQDPHSVSLIQIRSQDMKLQNVTNQKLKKHNTNDSRLSSRLRFTAYLSKKSSQKAQKLTAQHHQSLDLKSSANKQELSMSLRHLLNNLKFKNYTNSKGPDKPSIYSRDKHENLQRNGKIFDKDIIFKNYEEEEIARLKKGIQYIGEKKQSESKYCLDLKNKRFQKRSRQPGNVQKLSQSSKEFLKKSTEKESRQVLKISSPQKYYQKFSKKEADEKIDKIFNIKRVG